MPAFPQFKRTYSSLHEWKEIDCGRRDAYLRSKVDLGPVVLRLDLDTISKGRSGSKGPAGTEMGEKLNTTPKIETLSERKMANAFG